MFFKTTVQVLIIGMELLKPNIAVYGENFNLITGWHQLTPTSLRLSPLSPLRA
jgi:hypothetical protein